MGDLDSFSLSSLLCHENESCFLNDNMTDHNNIKHDQSCFVLETEVDVEYVERLVERETSSFGYRCHVSCDDCLITNHSWLKFARLDAIEWILNTRAFYGFRFHTAYLSVTYFDRFVSRRSIDEGKLWAIRLLSVACLSIAAKMEECKVPALSEFCVEDYCFENKVIQRMELLVLNTLEWRMNSITPFTYLHYFIKKECGESKQKEIVSRAVEFIVAMIKEIDLLDHRPSIIAAAAALAASNSQLTIKELELKTNMISSWGSLENGPNYHHDIRDLCFGVVDGGDLGPEIHGKMVSEAPPFHMPPWGPRISLALGQFKVGVQIGSTVTHVSTFTGPPQRPFASSDVFLPRILKRRIGRQADVWSCTCDCVL
ncbi:unnamed protein product [Dovyalis caffra]|uniref:B-like cyclin n=1 Tax=Dovyalis caffra TaxID=77055 RepID=A0AAV1RUC8_9ROSI|nr:unnamed protein product [Dovyalis caffra]